jgi:hypothetical protein
MVMLDSRYAEHKPGTKPIVMDPCDCKECVFGSGINFDLKHRRSRALSEIFSAAGIEDKQRRFCHKCLTVVWVISIDAGDHWAHTCVPKGHVWSSAGKF